ncbi:MAG TPA: hypothetical protein V6C58_12940 [Allocoleopsis sp.]
MSNQTELDMLKELKDLILGLDKKVSELDHKNDIVKIELQSKIDMNIIKIKQLLKEQKSKNNQLNKPLSNEEFISKTTIIAVCLGMWLMWVKMLFFENS